MLPSELVLEQVFLSVSGSPSPLAMGREAQGAAARSFS